MKEVFLRFLSKTLKKDADELAALVFKADETGDITDELNDDALKTLLDLDAARVQGIKPDTKTIFDNGHKKGLKEGAERLEAALRDRFNITEGATGDELLDLVQSATQGEMKPDAVKASKEYRELERAMKAELKKAHEERESEIAKIRTEFERAQTWQQAQTHIREALTGLNPVLPEDQAKAERMIALFMREFSDLEFQADEKEGFIPLKSGSRLEDGHGYGITLADLVKAKAAEVFDFREQAPAGNGGNKNTPTAKRVSAGDRFKNEADYLARYAAAGSMEEKDALYAAWQAQQTAEAN